MALSLVIVLPSSAFPQKETNSASSSKSKQKSKNSSSDTASKTSKLDLNTASKEKLDALPGIGPANAQKIIDGRPYKSKSDLERKGILPSGTYEKIKDQITAHRPRNSSETTEHENAAAQRKTRLKQAAMNQNNPRSPRRRREWCG
jgi:predicted DNA-binding helix-hairpin-helix protein